MLSRNLQPSSPRTAVFFLLISLSLLSCSSAGAGGNNGDSSERAELLADVSSWLYQLQNIDAGDVGASDFDLAVVDYSADGSDDEAFSAGDVDEMRGENGKLVIAYMSIGEAEDYRYYFDATASYVDQENPDWPGNYKVRYWEEEWQDVIESYVDRLVDAGFDGAYLDIIDAYEYYGPGGESGLERAAAADDMTAFVVRIAEYARGQDENFLIFPQNGSGILDAASSAEAYLDAVDGIGAEDTFYFGDEGVDNPLDEQTEVIGNLDAFVAAGKIVLSVDYLTDADKIDDFYERALTKSYVPYATVRDLNEMTVNADHEP